MASSVLGKRRRATLDSSATGAASAISLRSSKRRTKSPLPWIHEEEEDEPSIPQNTIYRSSSSRNNGRSKRTVPDKAVKAIATSPVKVIKSTETVTDENTRPKEFTTPQKAYRSRDALSNAKPTIPTTPKHRVKVTGKPLTPRAPRTLCHVTAAQSVYTPARQLFARSSNPGRLVGRDSEREELTAFIDNAVQSRNGGCIYVSGPPGTGKSAMVNEVWRDMHLEKSVRVAHINCASMTSSRDIYTKLVDELCDDAQLFKKSRTELLGGMFLQQRSASPAFYVVALDEIDHLLSSDVETLYSLFEWSLQPGSQLVLIGIANALDLTDRFLPHLKAKNLKPHLLPFLPYTAPQISSIITTRLRSLMPTTAPNCGPADFIPFLHPAAIQLCARKVASQTGDLRKAFDIVRHTIDLIEQEFIRNKSCGAPTNSIASSKTPLTENVNLASLISPPDTPSSSSCSSTQPLTGPVYTAATAPRATVAHVARVTSSAFGNGTTQRLRGLNLQQKAALCAMIALGRKQQDSDGNGVLRTPSKIPRSTASAAPTVNQLFATYSTLCRRDKILQPLSATEFRDVIGSLETLGLVGEAHGWGYGGTPSFSSSFSSSSSAMTPSRAARKKRGEERGLVCFVGEREVEGHIYGAGEGILRGLLGTEV
ncbi:cell division control protein [Paracoccidioides lutzii Pb01]|uniref:Cell division control protein n=1 Tax=Paracoccidioides lutzii (strain ATCC MYA-826 / Pb01) TaxID=502779 RepID=C1HE23_PARBA|nr:cell division control protein [Paracoccidioides lutzii Pb01]EEH40563.1 cell division control protein [Paracoccidioides lutzii Pb01]